MSSNARILLLIVGGIALLAGVHAIVGGGKGAALAIIGALVLCGTLFDSGYRARGGRGAPPDAQWQRTGEREINSLTGEPEEVWFDPVSGARRYERLGTDPNKA